MSFVPVENLKEGDIEKAKVRMPLYQVKNKVGLTVFFINDVDEFTTDTGYFELVSRNAEMRFVQNQDSGISHATVANKTLCGARHTQIGVTVEKATCKGCRRQMAVMVLGK